MPVPVRPVEENTSASKPEATPDPALATSQGRFATFYVVYVGLFALLFAYLISVRLIEVVLDAEFQDRVDRAIVVTSLDSTIASQMKARIDAVVHDSNWVRWGGIRVTTLVLARDGATWLYVDGHAPPPAPNSLAPTKLLAEWINYLPARADVTVTLPHNALLSNGLLILYTSILLSAVYLSNRRTTAVEARRLEAALAARNAAADRTHEIELELEETRSRLDSSLPKEQGQKEEIEALRREREALQSKLEDLAAREEAVRDRAASASDLAQEVRALEDLLEEATSDLETKDDEIGRLEQSLKKASKRSGRSASTKTRAAEQLARRFRTLYKTIEVDDRAIEDIASLGDESLRLKAEESVKRLADEAENVAVRRKVGGLPDHVQVYELGFAGKGRIYYTRGKSRRFRILLVGAKNSQSTDLEYLARLPRGEFT